jgi:hypothetical protein
MTSYESGTRSVRAPFGRKNVLSGEHHSAKSSDYGGTGGNIIINTHAERPDYGANVRLRPSSGDSIKRVSRRNGTASSREQALLMKREKSMQSGSTPRSRGRPKGENEVSSNFTVFRIPCQIRRSIDDETKFVLQKS